uniref:Sec-independent protein translocase protein TatA n=1 Tax=Haptolina brevifila TaxID=156173 RepID=A0A7S2FF39_9EUKA
MRTPCLLALLLCSGAAAFSASTSLPALQQSHGSTVCAARQVVSGHVVSVAKPACVPSRAGSSPEMGLFGLGWPEIAVISVIGLFFFGPEKLAPLAKDFGKQASGLKEVAESFQEGVAEGTTGVSSETTFGSNAVKSAETEKDAQKK